jgi:hypothetical protein
MNPFLLGAEFATDLEDLLAQSSKMLIEIEFA